MFPAFAEATTGRQVGNFECSRTIKVRYLGLSEANPSTIRRAHAIRPIAPDGVAAREHYPDTGIQAVNR